VAKAIRSTKPAINAIQATERREYFRDQEHPHLYLAVTPTAWACAWTVRD
jgi:hypothetical protein